MMSRTHLVNTQRLGGSSNLPLPSVSGSLLTHFKNHFLLTALEVASAVALAALIKRYSSGVPQNQIFGVILLQFFLYQNLKSYTPLPLF